MKTFIALIVLMATVVPQSLLACTTVIISGKYTSDGRPILWKHRDTDNLNNKLIYLSKGNMAAIALIDSDDKDVENIWIGFNSAGFAIMNSSSYNLKPADDTATVSDLEGILMKEALLSCTSVDDFELFLKNYRLPRGVEANFGVMDALGGAAYFETNNFIYNKVDVNDPRIAPHGYVVRTNYSFTGETNMGAGYIRFETAEKLFYRASASGNLNIPYMLENMSLSLENSYTGQKLTNYLDLNEKTENFIYFQDCINRYSTSSSVMVHGVKIGEPVEFTTLWAYVGFPLGSVPIPVWLTPKGTLPSIVTGKGLDNAEMCDLALELKKVMIPSRRGSTKYYINTTKIANSKGNGITQQLLPVRQEIVQKTLQKVETWRKNGKIVPSEVDAHFVWIDNVVRQSYRELFGLQRDSK